MKLEIFLVLVLGLVNGARILVWPAEWSHWINMKVRPLNTTQFWVRLPNRRTGVGASAQLWERLPNPGLRLRLLKTRRKKTGSKDKNINQIPHRHPAL